MSIQPKEDTGDTPEVALSTGQLAAVRETLAEYDVRLAVLFGSAAYPERDPNDIDIAVEFENWRPGDEGYTTVYLDLCGALGEKFDGAVDVVDVHSADDRFAAVIFRDGVLVYGPVNANGNLQSRWRTPIHRPRKPATVLLMPLLDSKRTLRERAHYPRLTGATQAPP